MPAKKKPTKAEAAALDLALWEKAKERITGAYIADGDVAQAEMIDDDHPRQLWMCSRRARKTTSACGRIAKVMAENDGIAALYLGLWSTSAETIWNEIWLPLLARLDVPNQSTADMITIFPNGSRVKFTGTDDLAHIKVFLGGSLAGSIAVLDEAQDADRVIEKMVAEVLGPMLRERTKKRPKDGQLIVCGTVPDLGVGWFWDQFRRGFDLDTLKVVPDVDVWKRRNFSRFDNPHLIDDQQAAMEAWCAENNLSVLAPLTLRIWKGIPVWDEFATAYRYLSSRNDYTPTLAPWAYTDMFPPGKLIATIPPNGIDRFSMGIDPGAHDRFSVVVMGWSSTQRKGVYQIAEWVTGRNANALESQWFAVVLGLLERYTQYGPMVKMVRDTTDTTTIDRQWRNHKVYIYPVKKGPGSLRAHVDRYSDLLGTGQAHVIAGSEVAKDLASTQWSKTARAKGGWEFGTYHPDPGMAATYALDAFFESAPAPANDNAIKTVIQILAEQAQQAHVNAFTNPTTRNRQTDASSVRRRR